MKTQSLSVVVPTKGCINNCPFCISKMHSNDYSENKFRNFAGIEKRLQYAKNNNINTLVLTGTGEPLQNKEFISDLYCSIYQINYNNTFPNMEIQTTGVFLSEYEEFYSEDGNNNNLRKEYTNLNFLQGINVNTISLSVCDIFDSNNNWNIMKTPKKLRTNLDDLCKLIKDYGFNLRLSINLLNVYNEFIPEEIFERCKELSADQVTFRELYSYDSGKESKWVLDNSCSYEAKQEIKKYIQEFDPLYMLPFGATVYSVNEMSVVLDSDCMSKNSIDSFKYLIIREDGKLYCRWDDKGSLIF